MIVASDVDNPLLGPNGAAAVYGPQKGADPDDVALLDAALRALGRRAGRRGPDRHGVCATGPAPARPAASATPRWPRSAPS